MSSNHKGWDLSLEFGKAGERWLTYLGCPECKVEVKRDDLWREKGNLFFEYECNGEPSGIAYTKSKWFVVTLNGEGDRIIGAFIFHAENLRKNLGSLVERGVARSIDKAGDGGRVRGWVVPMMFAQPLFLP